MDIQQIIEFENESSYVDFKKNQYQNSEDLLKDILAMANANIENKKRYIIIGVKYLPDGSRELHSIPNNDFKDDSDYQELVRSNIEPEIQFKYIPVEFQGKLLGVFEIEECDDRPYVMKKTYKRLEKGFCYIRRGSQNGRVIREDLEVIYGDRYKRKRQFEIKNSYLHLLKHEFKNNRRLLYTMDTYICEGPIIRELWDTASEISNHFNFEAWDSLMRSGVIASLEYEEMEKYRFAIKTIRDSIYYVREVSANWMRILAWNHPIYQSEVMSHELRQPASPKLVLQTSVKNCKESLKISQDAILSAIEILDLKHYS
ncbi:AlbA family DNA-binding domain-containing protein [Marinicrinis sediminis]|uniref:Helix-turn-helix domain-containing protein n=1 Tax=Marinicrinis sediminis TaxID=1652465 RepID=A0ABW5RB03_9BACL